MYKQPIFTSNRILYQKTIIPDRVIAGDDVETWLSSNSVVYTMTAMGLIERITITSCGDTSTYPNVHAKLVYVFLKEYASATYSLYKTFTMPNTTITHTTKNPSYELTFTGGIVLEELDEIIVASSIDASDMETNSQADYLSVVIEGGYYDSIY